MTEDMSRSVAVKAVWLWEGRRMARARRQRGGVEVEDIEIELILTGAHKTRSGQQPATKTASEFGESAGYAIRQADEHTIE